MEPSRLPVWLGPKTPFPDPALAGPEGLVAIGGDLSPERLLDAYRRGIFPWPLDEPGVPMLWWSPDPRFVLFPQELHVSRSLRQRVRSGRFAFSMDTAFEEVVEACASVPRAGQDGTWITREMIEAYVRLYELGWAHSAECRRDGRLVGGLYGVRVGNVFCGESMFSHESDASKVALVHLVTNLKSQGVTLIDCQQETPHLATLGARPVRRKWYLLRLVGAVSG